MESRCITPMLLLVLLGLLVSSSETNSGIPGIPGSHGVPGTPGRDGRDGPKGAKGEPGLTGSVNARGEYGEKGNQGMPGPIGKRGRRGPDGDNGDPGTIGEKGEKGRSGDHKSTLKSAFSAKRGGHEYPPRESPIRFTRIISNDQGHYDSSTGVFTCNITGHYYFVFHASSDNDLCMMMKMNGLHKAAFCSHGDFEQVSSGGIVLHLLTNDKVWLEATDYNALIGKEDHDSVFSGFLLFPD
ncbi:complement C1q subcomponent subunit C-like [Hypanus sabinus]|uniref:complement C1q subcomponent subunit C-like n=1 Tax=Hypanus sabinus TaxID=79690 RepID=UPI0028C41E16|nr:complement C1q subcomponent subunit C-like [Hypanus sabinus]XP_059807652.1 complement C1q subcomponent subunit C-like [Hypanus sabinus]